MRRLLGLLRTLWLSLMPRRMGSIKKSPIKKKTLRTFNKIAQLKQKYQGGPRAGAATIISRASAKKAVPKFKETVDPVTGRITRTNTDETFVARKTNKRTGEVVETVKPVLKRVERMALTDDAKTLLSDNPQPIENVYAGHANAMKALANQARRD